MSTTTPAGAERVRDERKRADNKSSEQGGRLHIYVPESLMCRLQELQRDTHAGSITDVVKTALTLYALVVEEHKDGGGAYLKRKEGDSYREIALLV